MANEVFIDGDANVTQLRVQAHTTQTNPLQTWEDDAGTALAQVTEDGRLEVGDTALMTTDESLIEAHSEGTAASDIQRGMNLFGKFTGAISDGIAWFMSELQLPGTGTISGIHAALRAKLTHDNDSNDSSAADLRAGDFEVVNQSGSGGTSVGDLTGVHARVDNQAGAYLTNARAVAAQIANGSGADIETAVALEVLPTENPSGTIDTLVGLEIADIDDGTDNYAIRTGVGQVKLGSLSTGLIKSVAGVVQNIDEEDDNDVIMGGASDTEDGSNGLVPQPLTGDEEKFLRGDGQWAVPPGTGGGANDYYGVSGVGFTDPNLQTWSALNHGSAVVNEDTTHKRITIDNPSGSGTDLRGYYKTAPSTPYVITAYFESISFDPPSGIHGFSLFFRDSSNSKLVTLRSMVNIGQSKIQAVKWNNAQSYNTNYSNNQYSERFRWLRIEDDGTDFKFYTSPDGIVWRQHYSAVSRTNFLTTPDQVGFALESNEDRPGMLSLLSWEES